MPKIKNDQDVNTDTDVKQDESVVDDVKETESPIAIPGTSVTEKMIEDWKSSFKKVFLTDYAGYILVWHRLNRHDFTTIYNDTQSIEDLEEQTAEREKRFCLAAILYPEKEQLENIIADDDIMASRICDEVLYKSGFFRPQTQEL